ncbi:hypothetical protein LX69_00626 [Breznakibacter xylanolyticus]|uniref:Uncharacterized protein n=1 Tax=Breznakibacter xylanolyticus TaxID=990 RepID=A0A2W7NJY5_9BACT|nr:hypothetical protein LX69_00626 [Breznakibacter xylanolyticus]
MQYIIVKFIEVYALISMSHHVSVYKSSLTATILPSASNLKSLF